MSVDEAEQTRARTGSSHPEHPEASRERAGAGAAGADAGTAPWRLELGANVRPGSGVRFAVWAPDRERVEVGIEDSSGGKTYHPLTRRTDGCHEGVVAGIGAGALYRYRLDTGPSYPDPCARCQLQGVHGPSQVVDPGAYRWRDAGWAGLDPERLVIYELHVGTFTDRGTFDSMIRQLPALKRLGITAIELMPVAECPGRRNWGYDGVDLYAPASYYGGPEALRRLVDAAHRQGLGVILDVVYNHLGPEGNYLAQYARDYFTSRYRTPWGDALNFDGPNSARVRRFMIENALYWLSEYHLDGLRLDAIHAIYDAGEKHVLAEIVEEVHARLPGPRRILIPESHDNDVNLIRTRARVPGESGGYGYDAVWADDFHHAVRTYLTGESDGYFGDYPATLQAVAETIERGFYYQGQHSAYWGWDRGTAVTDEPGSAFVFCIQNHDQVGNRAGGERLNHEADADRYAAASALLLLCPETPMLFMGQEFAASTPFLYFTDHPEELGRLVTQGRREEFKKFKAFSDPAARERIPDPQAESTFLLSKLNFGDRRRHAGIYRLYRDLLRLRGEDPVLRVPDRLATRAVTLGRDTLAMLRRTRSAVSASPAANEPTERLIVVHFGETCTLPLAEIAAALDGAGPADRHGADLSTAAWRTLWATRSRRGSPRLSGADAGRSASLAFPSAGAIVLAVG